MLTTAVMVTDTVWKKASCNISLGYRLEPKAPADSAMAIVTKQEPVLYPATTSTTFETVSLPEAAPPSFIS